MRRSLTNYAQVYRPKPHLTAPDTPESVLDASRFLTAIYLRAERLLNGEYGSGHSYATRLSVAAQRRFDSLGMHPGALFKSSSGTQEWHYAQTARTAGYPSFMIMIQALLLIARWI